MKESFNIPVVKHLEDIDDLNYGRDAGLVPNQEGLALKLAEGIYNHALERGIKMLLFSISTKQRAIRTAEMVREQINNIDPGIKIIVEYEDNLREIDQGEFVLPDDYEAGDNYAGLKIAGGVFVSETFNEDDPEKDSLLYKFGDPVLLADGSYKYPELTEYFTSPGESYRDVLVRFYEQVVKLSSNLERFNDKVDPVVFTHGQPHQIFTNLSEVANMIVNEGFSFETGQLARVCWELYKSKNKNAVPFGELVYIPADLLGDKNLVSILENEIEYLKSL